jgi:hypothetical protein
MLAWVYSRVYPAPQVHRMPQNMRHRDAAGRNLSRVRTSQGMNAARAGPRRLIDRSQHDCHAARVSGFHPTR